MSRGVMAYKPKDRKIDSNTGLPTYILDVFTTLKNSTVDLSFIKMTGWEQWCISRDYFSKSDMLRLKNLLIKRGFKVDSSFGGVSKSNPNPRMELQIRNPNYEPKLECWTIRTTEHGTLVYCSTMQESDFERYVRTIH